MIDFCSSEDLRINNAFFDHKAWYKYSLEILEVNNHP